MTVRLASGAARKRARTPYTSPLDVLGALAAREQQFADAQDQVQDAGDGRAGLLPLAGRSGTAARRRHPDHGAHPVTARARP
ncbi:hypothetical protein GCM10020221_24700 [Streptomyces thioluteus]|uniref:Uncharacterized protein n=1 Tax=Streptomyces thioluteus TaxID=66431 RepID=A0ABP6JBF3_STRTU